MEMLKALHHCCLHPRILHEDVLWHLTFKTIESANASYRTGNTCLSTIILMSERFFWKCTEKACNVFFVEHLL